MYTTIQQFEVKKEKIRILLLSKDALYGSKIMVKTFIIIYSYNNANNNYIYVYIFIFSFCLLLHQINILELVILNCSVLLYFTSNDQYLLHFKFSPNIPVHTKLFLLYDSLYNVSSYFFLSIMNIRFVLYSTTL